MKRFIILFGILFSVLIISGQNWVEQKTPTKKNIWSVYFTNVYTGYAVGNGGVILKTSNGGLSWKHKNSGVKDLLRCVFFPTEMVGYVSGEKGVILKTTDAGDNWTDISHSSETEGGGVWFLTSDKGFIVEGDDQFTVVNILRTLDGGETFDTVYSSSGWISYFHFPDAQNGFATASDGKILRTQDGGATWRGLGTSTTLWMSGVYFFDKDNGIIGGGSYPAGGEILKTSSAGDYWTKINTSVGSSRLSFVNSNVGYNIGTDSTDWMHKQIFKTIDGGVTWSVSQYPGTVSINDIQMFDENMGYAVGDSGLIYKYSNSYSISGKAKVEGNSISSGTANLFELTKNHKSKLIASEQLDMQGNYSFTNLVSGEYIVSVRCTDALYPNTLETYYGDVDYWESAQSIPLLWNDKTNADVNIIAFSDPPLGKARIEGYVVSLDGTRAGNDPIKDIDVTLKKVPGGEVKVVKTKWSGMYEFKDMPLGDYSISIDIPGLPMDSFKTVYINNSDTSIANVNFGVDSAGIHVDQTISTNEFDKEKGLSIYPNPASLNLIIDFKMKANHKIVIRNLVGQDVLNLELRNTKRIQLDISDYASGVYVIEFNNHAYKFVKY